MEGLIGVIVWVAIIVIFVKKFVNKNIAANRPGDKAVTPANKMPYISQPSSSTGAAFNTPRREPSGAGNVYSGGVSRKTYKAERATHTQMEDRSNDWLAHQLSDERRALYKANSMFGQQMEHRQVCDARMLKEYHLANCSADGIDMAEYK